MPVQLQSDDARTETAPQIAVDASGNALAVWEASGAGVSSATILASRFSAASGSWSAPKPIEAINGGAQTAQIAFDRSGNALAIWLQDNAIWTNRYTASSDSWGVRTKIASDPAAAVQAPKLAVSSDGTALAVWSQSKSGRVNVGASRFE
jgi:hypothetical protein